MGGNSMISDDYAARYLKLSDEAFELAKGRPDFPSAIKIRRKVFYLERELDTWKASLELKSHNHQPEALETLALILRQHSIDITEQAKATSGIYILLREGEPIYVGQSVNVYCRITQHYYLEFDNVKFIPCEKSVLDLVETIVILLLDPPKNGPPPIRNLSVFELKDLGERAVQGRTMRNIRKKRNGS